jgi:hypothetical protein
MDKKISIGLTIVVILLGLFFIGLDVLDIAEDYRLHISIAFLNTIFISAIAIFVAVIAARIFMLNRSFEIIGAGSAMLVFGIGILIYGWFNYAGLNVRITIYDSIVLLAALLHFTGVILTKVRLNTSGLNLRYTLTFVVLIFLGFIAIIIVFTWLLYRGILPSSIILRDLKHIVAAIFSLTAAYFCYVVYIKSHSGFHYWYSLGLVLFAFGVFIISRGALESRVAWLGRFSLYLSCTYLLVAVFSAYRRINTPDVK